MAVAVDNPVTLRAADSVQVRKATNQGAHWTKWNAAE
jgi:hypothetical protein